MNAANRIPNRVMRESTINGVNRQRLRIRLRIKNLMAAALVLIAPLAIGPVWAADTMALLPPGTIPGVQSENSATSLPETLSAADVALYARIFELQEIGEWAKADRLIARLGDTLLLGHVQSQRYMHPTKYRSRYKELHMWLKRYGDHPDATRVYRLALKRQIKGWKPPKVPVKGYLNGNGPHSVVGDASDLARSRGRAIKLSHAGRSLRSSISKQIRRGRPTAAYKLLKTKHGEKLLGPDAFAAACAEIAHGYFVFGKDDLALKVAMESLRQSSDTAIGVHWTAGLALWRLGNYAEAGHHFETLVMAEGVPAILRSAAAYWASRVHLINRQPAQATRWLVKAATYPASFYGLLARRALGIAVPLDWGLPRVDAAAIEELSSKSGGRRAFALMQVGNMYAAEREFRKLYPALEDRYRRVVMTIAAENSMPALAVRIAGLIEATGERPHYGALYPVPAWKVSNERGIDKALLLSIIRQESHFNTRAKSRRGARGLMQLMPRTAAYISGDKSLRGNARHRLYDPNFNIDLGQQYIRHLLDNDRVKGDLFRLLAAYNAGPGNLGKWDRKVKYQKDPLLFIESIPSRETRRYIETVLTDMWMYRLRLSQRAPSLERVAAGAWPTYQAVDSESGGTTRHAGN